MEKEIYIDTISNEILEKQMLYWDNGNVREEWYGLNGDFHGSDFHRSDVHIRNCKPSTKMPTILWVVYGG